MTSYDINGKEMAGARKPKERPDYIVDRECFRCFRCLHIWIPRSGEPPRTCPSCNSPYWGKPRSIK